MLNRYWFDKIAAAEEAAAMAAEDAMAEEEAMAQDELAEDLAIAETVVSSDLPVEAQVAIMEDQGVDPDIIDEVISANAVEKVSAYYGINPFYLSDKLADWATEEYWENYGDDVAENNARVAKKDAKTKAKADRRARTDAEVRADRRAEATAAFKNETPYYKAGRRVGMREGTEKAGGTIRQLRSERGALREQINALSQQLGVSQREAADYLAQLNGLKGEKASMNELINSLGADRTRLSTRLDETQALVDQLTAENSGLQSLSDRYKKGVAKVGKDLKATQAQLADAEARYAGTIDARVRNLGKSVANRWKALPKAGRYGALAALALGTAGAGYGVYNALQDDRPWYKKMLS